MARELDAALAALITAARADADDPKGLGQIFTLHIQMNDGTELYLATAPCEIGGHTYTPILAEPGLLRLSMFSDDDTQEPKVSNVEPSFGQTLCSAVNRLDGARATSGVLFRDEETGAEWWDERLPGELLGGEVTEERVPFDLVDEVYAITVSGERVVDIHPFRQPAATAARPDPNDNQPGGLLQPDPVAGWMPPGGRGDDGGRPNRFPVPADIFL